jgi:hypothetical protein
MPGTPAENGAGGGQGGVAGTPGSDRAGPAGEAPASAAGPPGAGAAASGPSANPGGAPNGRGDGPADAGGDQGLPASPTLAPGPARRSRPPSPLSRLLGNRDWPITVECQADAVVLRPTSRRIPLASLEAGGPDEPGLVAAVRKLIDDRQALVRPGEAPYRPVIRFLVHPEGLRVYYLAYPLLEGLRLPMLRENVEPPPRPPATIER